MMSEQSNAVSAPAHEVIVVPDYGTPGREALKQQCIDVRIQVFVHEQGFPLESEIDEYDETATHILLRLVPSLEPIGTIRLVKLLPKSKDHDNVNDKGSNDQSLSHYKLSRLAVLKDYRRYRFGRTLVLALHECVKRDAAPSNSSELTERANTSANYITKVKVIAHSQIPVKAFYAKYGYTPEGDEFDEEGAPHQKMVVYLPLSN